MKWILKTKWIWLFAWVVFTLVIYSTMPSLDDLIKEKGQPQVEGNFKSKIANDLQKEMSQDNQSSTDMILVYHDEQKFSLAAQQQIEKKIDQLKKLSDPRVIGVVSPFDNIEAKKRLFSSDQKTLMVMVSLEKAPDRLITELRDKLKKEAQVEGITTYLTGNALITEDYAQTSIDGVKKTELFAVVFIIAVLIFVFRSPVTPLISLATVGIAYLASIGVVANLVEYLDFPFANTTQIFLVLVLFGIGTDYNILLFMRFKEELHKHESVDQAVLATYRTAGKTVFYSGLAIFIGFSMLGLSNFSIYQSGVAVAIGVIFLLLILFTVVPLFMSLMGKTLFWPVRKIGKQRENPIWKHLGRFSIKRPVLSILLIVLLCLPIPFFYQGKLSFDSLQEVNPSFESVKGFQLVANAFGAGQTLPTELLIKHDQELDTPEGLVLLDELHQRLMRMDGVKSVYGPTRPSGERIDLLYANTQTKEVKKGIDQSTKGLDQISGGLSDASNKIGAHTSGDMSDVNKLISGTSTIQGGMGQVEKALKQIQTGLNQGATGADHLSQGIGGLEKGLQQLGGSTERILAGYQSFAHELKKSEQQLKRQLEQQKAAVKQAGEQIIRSADALIAENPELAGNQHVITMKQTGERLKENAEHPTDVSFTQAIAQLEQANQGLKQVIAGQKKLKTGAKQLKTGADQLTVGLKKGASGQTQVIQSLGQINQGLGAVNQGQEQLQAGLTQFEASMKELQKGLTTSSQGIDKVNTGLNQANDFLADLSGDKTLETFYVPETAKNDPQFQQALDMYLSKDRKIATWTIALDVDPYSEQAMKIVQEIDQTIKEAVKHTPYENLTIGTAGVSSINSDLHKISSDDFSRTVILMLIGISLMLIILFRSFWTTVFVMLSLVVAYFTSIFVSEIFFIYVLGLPGLSWTVPFFSFILIVSLGVDYSIFLLMRYQEYPNERPTEAITKALKHIGGVVISAAMILCGTFAALYPSGVATLVQIATVVIIGLVILAVLLLPLFLPATIALMDQLKQREEARRMNAK